MSSQSQQWLCYNLRARVLLWEQKQGSYVFSKYQGGNSSSNKRSFLMHPGPFTQYARFKRISSHTHVALKSMLYHLTGQDHLKRPLKSGKDLPLRAWPLMVLCSVLLQSTPVSHFTILGRRPKSHSILRLRETHFLVVVHQLEHANSCVAPAEERFCVSVQTGCCATHLIHRKLCH